MPLATAERARSILTVRRVRRVQGRRHLLWQSTEGQYRGFLPHFPPKDDPEDEYKVGPHLLVIADWLEKATRAVERGESMYLAISCPPRHSKSHTVVKRYPAWHLGRNPDHEILLASYSSSLVHKHSRGLRALVKTPEYQRMFGVSLSRSSSAVDSWELAENQGSVNAVGFDGSITGKGAHVAVIDDPHKGWLEAQSETQRGHVWQTFTNDIMTRLAPAHALVLDMTRWHVDDVVGRIKEAMDADPDFPRFHFLVFPWREAGRVEYPDGRVEEIPYPTEYLFEARYDETYYRRMRAALVNPASGPALYDCEPVVQGGNRFEVNRIQYHESAPPGLDWVRYWDLASSRKEREGDNPSRTAGSLVAVRQKDNGAPELWVKDCVYGYWKAPQRDATIAATARRDGMGVDVVLETVGGYVDAAAYAEEALEGFSTVSRDAKQVEKDIRAQNVEPVFADGNVHFVRGDWTSAVVKELSEYPAGATDDIVDTITGGFADRWNPDEWLIG
jgi:phage terminase large subunit-like protein